MFLNDLTVPALNKWTAVAPGLCQVTALQQFWGSQRPFAVAFHLHRGLHPAALKMNSSMFPGYGFSSKLRTMLTNQEALLSDEVLLFLDAVFDRVVPTSTFIERTFARFNRWCDRKGPKPQLSSLAAKHTVYHFCNLIERWRRKQQKEGTNPKPKGNLCRPSASASRRCGRWRKLSTLRRSGGWQGWRLTSCWLGRR